jgi:hypothetical protein
VGATITEALAEIKTIGKRIDKKQEFIFANLARQEGAKDPLEKEGGTAEKLKTERQALDDLLARVVTLRRGIQRANDETNVTIGGETRSISEWLVWRRDVAPKRKDFLNKMSMGLKNMREQSKRQGLNVVSPGAAQAYTDIVVSIDEGALAKDIESLESILGELDGQLSLKNATVLVSGI